MPQIQPLTLARHAMATRFELVLHGANPVSLRAAGEEALEEIERLESRLSLFRPDSDIGRANARAGREPVRVTPEVFALLGRAKELSEQTGGAFDITIAPLVRCWGFMGGTGRMPETQVLEEARMKVGMHLVELDAENCTVEFARDGVMLDLGAIGKGYAVERAADILREAGVSSALIHGGTSTIHALGNPPDSKTWRVALTDPRETGAGRTGGPALSSPSEPAASGLTTVELKDEALSVSAVSGKYFEAGGKLLGHVLDPRTGQPAGAAALAAVVLPSATETDALSTALLVLGLDGLSAISKFRPGIRAVVAAVVGDRLQSATQGMTVCWGR